jgi:hypothetical protein
MAALALLWLWRSQQPCGQHVCQSLSRLLKRRALYPSSGVFRPYN